MRVIEPETICPYTGLRSFTEEESLYFKGRDTQVDQITALLEQNKFLMVTGASGDGKSSLVYAGLIPNARAGFFRTRYSNWLIADFRPERDPLGNMAASVAHQLQVSADTVKTELRRGYSSLVDLYTSSPAFAGEEDASFESLTDAERKEKKRTAANMLILLDQFEEFFTNPENLHGEAPSTDAQTVVNLVLETARIALKRNLPIYIVCTMRSDYIGQCSAFRGLPEYIGFSQFFVPRLKRRDLKQVIEEPAILSGNRITQRLIERLVYDVAEGVDQLPILQHALSRIWKAADQGREEMDLLHYAKVGGMPVEDLPDEDQALFEKWFATLPEGERKYYRKTGLNRIIDIHANLLYENAWSMHNDRHPDNPVSQKAAKRTIAIAFSCLTKIDNSRAVRNRMTLAEVTRIVNDPDLSAETVGHILDIFREDGNSFIRPFRTGDPDSEHLHPGAVLDITHESLIRNWDKLNAWAEKEFEFYTTWLDLRKQLDRWKHSGKSRGFLLPIGPLAYFDNWYKGARPNEGWLERYDAPGEDGQEPVRASSEQTMADIREFLRKSTAKEWLPRTFMKYGARRVLTGLAVLIMLGLTIYYWYDAERKRNRSVIDTLKTEAAALLTEPEVKLENKAYYLIALERQDSGKMMPILSSRPYRERLPLAIETYGQLLQKSRGHQLGLRNTLLQSIIKDLEGEEATQDPGLQLQQANRVTIQLAMDQYYMPEDGKRAILTRLVALGDSLAIRYFKDPSKYRTEVPQQLNLALQYWLTFGQVTPQSVDELLRLISPRSGPDAESRFKAYYPAGSYEPNGKWMGDHNGGFHTLASLYAAAGDTAGVNWCFSKLIETGQRNYFEMARVINNHNNIIGYLYQYGHRDMVPEVLAWIGSHTNDNPPLTLLRNVVIRSGYITHMYFNSLQPGNGLFRATGGYAFPNLYFCTREQFDAECADHEAVMKKEKDPNEVEFQLAMSAKRKAMFYQKYWYDRGMAQDTSRLNAWFSECVEHFGRIDSAYLEATQAVTLVYNSDGVRNSSPRRRDLFLYPDYRDGWFANTYHGDAFFYFMQRRGLLDILYKDAKDLQNLHLWLAKAFEWKAEVSSDEVGKTYPLPDGVLKDLLAFVDRHPAGASFDKNLPYVVLAERAFEAGDTTVGLSMVQKIDLSTMPRSLGRYEYLEKIFIDNMVSRICMHLAEAGKPVEARNLVGIMDNDRQRAMTYFMMAEQLYRTKMDPAAFRYLDSGFRTMNGIPYVDISLDVEPRLVPIRVLSGIGGLDVDRAAADQLRQLPEVFKYFGVASRVIGLALEGNYHQARMAISPTLTQSQDLDCHTYILLEDSKVKEKTTGDKEWAEFDSNLYWPIFYNNYYPT